MATGTGDLAAAVARKNPEAAVTGMDLSPGMVRLGREKMVRKGLSERVRMEVGDGESLDIPDSAFDCATIAFGIRNYQDIPAGLREFFRVLRPGGKVFILEFSTPHGWFFGPLYRFYFHRILPVIGGLVSRDKAAYSYLPGSVGEFPEKELFLRMMSDSGLENVTAKRLMRGVAYIYSGGKPLDP